MPEIFTYGSLMYPEVVEIILGRPIPPEALRDASLEEYRRVAIPDRSYPTGIAASGYRIDGKLLGLITEAELQRLDEYEESFYSRVAVSVRVRDEIRQAFTYIDSRSPLPFELNDWDPKTFEQDHLPAFVQKLRVHWRAGER